MDEEKLGVSEQKPEVTMGQNTNKNDLEVDDKCVQSDPDPKKEGYSSDKLNKKENKIDKYPHLTMKGQFATMPKDKLIKISKKAGSVKNPNKGKKYSLCLKCEARFSCKRAFEETHNARAKGKDWPPEERARCVFEIEGRALNKDKVFRDLKAFISSDPTDLLLKIESQFKRVEAEAQKDPSYTKAVNLLYILQNIYRLKFGEKMFNMNVNKNINSGNPSLDIKEIMKEIRKDDVKDVDAEVIKD